MKTVNNSPPPTVTIKLTAGGDCIVSLAQEMLYQDPVVVASLSEMVVSAVTIRAGHLHLLQIQILSDAAAAWLGLLYFGSLYTAARELRVANVEMGCPGSQYLNGVKGGSDSWDSL